MTDSRHPGPGAAESRPGGATRTPSAAEAGATGDATGSEAVEGLHLDVATPSEGVEVLTVGGELDMLTAPELRRDVLARIPAVTLVVLDLDGVRFLGTSGLAALIEIREQAHRSGVELRIACTELRVLRPLGIAGLHHLFDIHDDVETALQS
ncbi:anti-anti-sigma factor [Pseudonocardia ammonioxydans]|uniref:Anti-sigma factor antagonist n=1 Tax=Pseudonocardia ammonioxydans TaxID=260086 RepID=A0A1I4W0W4_PSUAM|nr:anti-sigma factor antagonist [Pseudonocardia ammonioxydans]SFN06876.1 anti-anti-sigma factor [Pseudonocardia ammonioxydans]